MKRPEPTKVATDFGGRLALAIDAAGTTQTKTEKGAGLKGQGRIYRLLGKGKNPILSPGPEVIMHLADFLKVSYEWLAIGRGPMRAEGVAADPLEDAKLFARRHGASEEAIREAIAHARDAERMNGIDWVIAFVAETVRLERAQPRPARPTRRKGAA